MQAERDAERARADHAERELVEARREAAMAKMETKGEREARAIEVQGLGEMPAEARKPWWLRLFT